MGGGIIRTNIYIDGFNLYYGCLKGTPYKWLNIDAFFRATLPKNAVQRIRYFTAKVEARPGDPGIAVRQATFLRALATLPSVEVEFGTFLASPNRAPLLECDAGGQPTRVNGQLVVKRRPSGSVAMAWVHKSEEKGSDVNLASYLLRDAFRGDCDCAVVVSNDSDLLTPIRIAQQECGMKVGLITPRPKGSVQLRHTADFQRTIRTHVLASSQFPETFNDSAGTITKPAGW